MSFPKDVKTGRPAKESGPRVNHQIRCPEIRLIGDDGTPFGVLSIDDARRLADEKGLDLVEVSPTARPPVVKLIDYGKYKYQLQKKAAEAKKKQVVVQLKEIQLRPNIEKHDLEVKLRKAADFLDNGDRVKLIMQFRGRELAYKKAGMEKFQEILTIVTQERGIVESPPSFNGPRLMAMLAPSEKK